MGQRGVAWGLLGGRCSVKVCWSVNPEVPIISIGFFLNDVQFYP